METSQDDVGGFTDPLGTRVGLGALLVGYDKLAREVARDVR